MTLKSHSFSINLYLQGTRNELMDGIRALVIEVFNWSCCLNMKKPLEVKFHFYPEAKRQTRDEMRF